MSGCRWLDDHYRLSPQARAHCSSRTRIEVELRWSTTSIYKRSIISAQCLPPIMLQPRWCRHIVVIANEVEHCGRLIFKTYFTTPELITMLRFGCNPALLTKLVPSLVCSIARSPILPAHSISHQPHVNKYCASHPRAAIPISAHFL